MQQRLTLGDQEGAQREVEMRNREEILLSKKTLNVVDEMQLGLINLEKSYTSIRDLVAKVFDQAVREGRQPPLVPRRGNNYEEEEEEIVFK